MEKRKTEVVFVVLTYRNFNDLNDFFVSLRNVDKPFEVVIVNSYFDDASRQEFQNIAEENHAYFINVENKGYGAGNNKGIAFANENIDYEFLVISNSDIMVENINSCLVKSNDPQIIGPQIITLKGKNQNPFYYKKSKFILNTIMRQGNNTIRKYFYQDIILNKFYTLRSRVSSLLKRRQKVFALHGSFFLFNKHAVMLIGQPFDEKMFLFGEELHLALVCNKIGINLYYDKNSRVTHKEDGSISLLSDNLKEIHKKSLEILSQNFGEKK